MPNRVNWYQHDVMVRANRAMEQSLLAIAFQIEAEAKPNAPVDTGFMRNSAYVVGAGTNTFVSRQDGDKQTASSAEPAPEGGVTIGFGALYTIYVESQQPFFYPAALSVANQAGGTIEAVGRREFQ